MLKLFAAIDAEPERKPSTWFTVSSRISDFFAGLSPRTLAWSASLAALALLLQAGAIAVMVAHIRQVRRLATRGRCCIVMPGSVCKICGTITMPCTMVMVRSMG